MKYKVYVDGQEGTTGLKINERLQSRNDIEILKIDSDKRKNLDERKRLLNEADIAFLCLPDNAAIESVSLVENSSTRIIDASTAHRTNPDWVYGLPELSKEQRIAVKNSKRVAVPGCYPTGFNSIMYPLVKENIVPNDYPVTCTSVSGYSGAGKKLIEQYEAYMRPELNSIRFYGLGLSHKHLPEMQKISGLKNPPIFLPSVANIFQGMLVTIPFYTNMLQKKMTPKEIHEFLSSYYKAEHFIKVMPFEDESNLDNGFLGALGTVNTNFLNIYVFGNNDQVLLVSQLDNLGKGASGAAVQNMNIMLGLDESIGL